MPAEKREKSDFVREIYASPESDSGVNGFGAFLNNNGEILIRERRHTSPESRFIQLHISSKTPPSKLRRIQESFETTNNFFYERLVSQFFSIF